MGGLEEEEPKEGAPTDRCPQGCSSVVLDGKGPVCSRSHLLVCCRGSQLPFTPLCPLLLEHWTKNNSCFISR